MREATWCWSPARPAGWARSAGQIARLLGAAGVIGTTGTPGKAARLTAELGYDTV
ncbi:hypothetical protein SFUMM280S_06212 [Streptomyces fumanus]